MGTSNEDIIKSINNYQERLDRYVSNKNEDKMLYVVKKLDQLPINTSHLENTGVGRTVNALKKLEGKVGEAAKELVASWKDMVLREEKATQENARAEPEDDVDSVYSSDHEGDNLYVEENSSSRHTHLNSNSKRDRYNEYTEDAKRVNSDGSEICSETEQEVEHQFASSPEEKVPKKRHHSSDRDEDGKSEKHKSKKSKKDHRREDEYKRESKSKTDKKSTKESSHKTSNEYKKSKDISDESSRHKSEKRKKESGKYNDEKSHRRSDKKESHSSNSDSRSDSKNDISKKSESKSKSHRDKSSDSKKSKSREEYSTDSKSASSKEHSKEHKSHKKSKVEKPANKDKIVNGIGSESGASFAEALGMCGPKTATVSSKKKPASSTSSEKYRNSSSLETDTSAGSSSTYTASSSHRRSDPAQQEAVPELLKEKELEPLNINISSLLPEITPNYRPLGINFDQQPKRVMTDDEALSRVMSNRNQRTKVYSGNKSFGKVESLFQICVRILQDNIDALEYTGGVPFIILKPILERATPDQLFNMEHHNPYLIEDTDDLWALHCQKEFRNKKREELESWREMYMRCLDEREARLNAITANIKQSQDKSIPIRTTKLAYIDSVVKPPRNVIRQQARNGISVDKKHISTSAKLSAIAKSGEAGKIAVPNPGSRGGERSSSSAAMKPKKAPLMAKTLSFFKNRFKR